MTVSLSGQSFGPREKTLELRGSRSPWESGCQGVGADVLDILWASTMALPLNLPAASLLGLLGLEGFLFCVLGFYLFILI